MRSARNPGQESLYPAPGPGRSFLGSTSGGTSSRNTSAAGFENQAVPGAATRLSRPLGFRHRGEPVIDSPLFPV